jgi:phosphomannomutase
VRDTFEPLAARVDETDGLSLEFEDWRFNLRSSNTEPVVRLNAESRGQVGLLAGRIAMVQEVLLRE